MAEFNGISKPDSDNILAELFQTKPTVASLPSELNQVKAELEFIQQEYRKVLNSNTVMKSELDRLQREKSELLADRDRLHAELQYCRAELVMYQQHNPVTAPGCATSPTERIVDFPDGKKMTVPTVVSNFQPCDTVISVVPQEPVCNSAVLQMISTQKPNELSMASCDKVASSVIAFGSLKKTDLLKQEVPKNPMRHRNKRNAGSNHLCQDCGYLAKTALGLKQHMKRTHTVSKTHTYMCESCGYASNNKMNLTRHLREFKCKDESEYPFACNVCKKRFVYQSQLNYHLRVHTKVNAISCHLCGKQVSDKHSLNTHLASQHQVAVENKIFKCGVCDKEFYHSRIFRAHKRLHSKIECDMCSQSFISQNLFLGHKLGHFGLISMTCPLCKRGIRDYAKLIMHMKKVHKVKKQNRPMSLESNLISCVYCGGCKTSKVNQLYNHILENHKDEGSDFKYLSHPLEI